MKSTSKISKICFCLLLVMLLAFSLTSCKKTDKDKETNNAAMLVNQEAVKNAVTGNSEKNPVVVVPVPEIKEEKKTASNEKSTIVESAKEEKAQSSEKPQTPSFATPDVATSSVVKETSSASVGAPSSSVTEAPAPQVSSNTKESSVNKEESSENNSETGEVLSATISASSNFTKKDLSSEEETPSWPVTASFVYGGVDASITIDKDKAEILFNGFVPSKDSVSGFVEAFLKGTGDLFSSVIYTLDGDKITLTYPEGQFGDSSFVRTNIASLIPQAKEAIDSLNIQNLPKSESLSQDYMLYGKKVTITAQKDKAVITSEAPFTKEEINEALEILKANFPEETKYVYYTPYADRIEIVYPEVSMDYITSALKAFDDLILAYTPMPIETMALSDSPASTDQNGEGETTTETESSEPLTQTEKTLTKFSVALAPRASLDFSHKDSPIALGFDIRGEYKFNDIFSIGASIGYDAKGYIPLSLYGKYYFMKEYGLYSVAKVGAAIGLQDNPTDFTVGIGIGYEYNVLDNLTVFAEVGGTVHLGDNTRIVPGLTIGGRYTF